LIVANALFEILLSEYRDDKIAGPVGFGAGV
jgi:hypothetical protein